MQKFFPLLMKRHHRFLAPVSSVIFCFLFTSFTHLAQADSPATPPVLTSLLTGIDTAANQGNVKGVMQYFSPKFTHSDGLTYEAYTKALTVLWNRYPNLHYSSSLLSWKSEGNSITAKVVTNITGLPATNDNNLALKATITSTEKVVDDKIVRQDILSERTEVTSGTKPPHVDVTLPKSVSVGQKYEFDAIVQEPLGDDFLLGKALEEAVKPEEYINPTNVQLELLNSGGLFKVGEAPSKPGHEWISAVIVGGDGSTIVTQRLQVVKK